MAHVVNDLVGRAEAKGRGVADVELEDAQALVLHAGRLVGNGAADVVEDVVELAGLFELSHDGAPFGGGDGCGGCGLRPRGSSGGRSRREPVGIHAEKRREQAHDVRPRGNLAAHVLADLALSELLAARRRHVDKIGLLEAALAHGLAQSVREGRCGHPVSLSSTLELNS